MRLDLEALRPWSVARAAAALELHPFEVIRVLVAEGGVPVDLRLRPEDITRVVRAGGLEAWWAVGSESTTSAAVLVSELARQLLARGIVDPVWTRADNVFRGLDPRAQAAVRRAVNAWIRSGAMGSRMSARGLELTVRATGANELRALADGQPGVYAELLGEP
jgi:hypothetical protein